MSQGFPKKIICRQCTMSLRVERPPEGAGERWRCPDCKRPFWNYEHDSYKEAGQPKHIRVGILPQWLPEWQA